MVRSIFDTNGIPYKTVCVSKKMSNKVILTILLSFFSNIKSDVVTNKHKWSPELDG